MGNLDRLLGASRGAGRGSGAATPNPLPPQGVLVVRGPHSHSSRGDPWNEWEFDGHSASASVHGTGDRRVNPTIYPAQQSRASQPMRGPVTREMPMEVEGPDVVPGTINYSTVRQGVMGPEAEQRLNALLQRDRDRRYAQENAQRAMDAMSQDPAFAMSEQLANPQSQGNMRGSNRLADWTPPYAYDPLAAVQPPPAFFNA